MSTEIVIPSKCKLIEERVIILNTDGDCINPSTEEKQDNIITALGETIDTSLVSFDAGFLDTPLPVTKGMNIPIYDYVVRGWTAGAFTEVWTFKTGGSGGTTVATITIVYDDVNKSNIVTVTQT